MVSEGVRLQLDKRWGESSFWCWLIGFYLAFMPLYLLGFMGMPRRMEHYDIAAWQPYLIVAAAGAVFVLFGIAFLVVQIIVSVRAARRATERRSMEWAYAGMAHVFAAGALQFRRHSRSAGYRRISTT